MPAPAWQTRLKCSFRRSLPEPEELPWQLGGRSGSRLHGAQNHSTWADSPIDQTNHPVIEIVPEPSAIALFGLVICAR